MDCRVKPGNDASFFLSTKRRHPMTKVSRPVLFRLWPHREPWPNAVAEGAREAGATVDIKRVPELVPPDVAKASHYKLDQAAPVAKIEDLAELRRHRRRHRHRVRPDGVADVQFPRPGRRAVDEGGAARQGRRRLHLDRDPAGAGQETTLFSIVTNLLHFGMVLVGPQLRFWRPR